MPYKTTSVQVKKTLWREFKMALLYNGDTVSDVLRDAIQTYIIKNRKPVVSNEDKTQ